jgi:pantothenate synthetase
MSKKKNDKTIAMVLLGGGLLLYLAYKRNASLTPVISVGPDGQTTLISNADPARDAVVASWFNQLGSIASQHAFSMYPQMSEIEKNTLATIIQNYFNTGTTLTPELQNFWNIWTVKYHIQDGMY